MRKKPGQGRAPGGTGPRVITQFAEYVGSFAVKEADWRRRVWIIEDQMSFLKDCPRRRSVILKFCLQGVKMYDAQGETLLMAHALRRIQYTSCRLEDCQFAFVSRNPHGPAHQLYCHLFVGSQPSEAQLWNLLLCRSFQLQYLLVHPEVQDPYVSVQKAPPKVHRRGGIGVMREPLDPEEVSQNVNALVSFRRLPLSGEDVSSSGQTEISDRESVARTTSLGNPYCSPTLVRKKAIRSKVLRSGAYRCANYGSQLQGGVEGISKCENPDICISTELTERMEILQYAVWCCAGISRDCAISLLKDDRVGAFLIRADPDSVGQRMLFLKTQCGVIPYKIRTTQRGAFCFEHLKEEHASLSALVDHHAGTDGSLFYQLAHGRVNPCYEVQEPKLNTGETTEPVQS